MIKRVFASLALIGFVLLVLNLLVFQVQTAFWATVYVFIVIVFLVSSRSKEKEIEDDTKGQDVDTQE